MDLKLEQVAIHDSHKGTVIIGRDEDGNVWKLDNYTNLWRKIPTGYWALHLQHFSRK